MLAGMCAMMCLFAMYCCQALWLAGHAVCYVLAVSAQLIEYSSSGILTQRVYSGRKTAVGTTVPHAEHFFAGWHEQQHGRHATS